MKAVQLILVVVLIASCSKELPPEGKAIADYVQAIEGSKVDLSFKLIELDEVGVITGMDSAIVIKAQNIEYRDRLMDKKIEKRAALIAYKMSLEESVRLGVESAKLELANTQTELEEVEGYIALAENDSTGFTVFNLLKPNYERYLAMQDSVLARKVKCKYSIQNPFLNNAKQEITRVFVLAPDGSKVLEQESK